MRKPRQMRQHLKRIVTKVKRYIPYLVLLGALLLFGGYLYRNVERYRQLLNISGEILAGMAMVTFLSLAINGGVNYFFCRGLGVSISFHEAFGLASVNTLANQLPFAGGMITKSLYLKRNYHLAYTQFFSATLALYVIFVATNGALGIIVLIHWRLMTDIPVPASFWFGFGIMTASLTVLRVPTHFDFLPERWTRRFAQLVNGWRELTEEWKTIVVLVSFQVVTAFLVAARYWLAFRILSQDVTLSQCLLFSAATVLTRLISIAPGGLGVREGIVAALAVLLGFDAGVSLVAVGLDRLVATTIVIMVGTGYSYILGRNAVTAEISGTANGGVRE